MLLAATAVFWILATATGSEYDLGQRVRALLDLIALAGFGLGIWLTYKAWRAGRGDKR